MSKIHVLALNDGEHDICFVTHGSYYSDATQFMKECLLKPHTTEYEIGYFCLSDDEENAAIFDCLTCEYNPETLFVRDRYKWLQRENAFEYIWSISNKERFYV